MCSLTRLWDVSNLLKNHESGNEADLEFSWKLGKPSSGISTNPLRVFTGKRVFKMKNKQTHDFLQKEMHKSTFFFDFGNLLNSMKSWLQKYKISKKLEPISKKELVYHKQLLQKYLNCSCVKESHEINMTWYSYIG